MAGRPVARSTTVGGLYGRISMTREFYLEKLTDELQIVDLLHRISDFVIGPSWSLLDSFVDNKTHTKYEALYKVVGAGTEPR
jgi:hypothetical protein